MTVGLLRLAPLAALLWLGACTSLFNADFETDTLSAPPAPLPPGPPSDQISFSSSTLTSPATLSVEEQPTGGRALTLTGGGDAGVVVFLLSDQATLSNGRILAAWTQTLIGGSAGNGVRLFFGDAANLQRSICTLDVTGLLLALDCGTGEPILVEDVDVFEPHRVFVTFDRGAGVSLLSVSQGGTTVVSDPRAVDGTIAVRSGARLRTQISFLGGANTVYAIDDFTVTELP